MFVQMLVWKTPCWRAEFDIPEDKKKPLDEI
jgi:hypothetical protein